MPITTKVYCTVLAETKTDTLNGALLWSKFKSQYQERLICSRIISLKPHCRIFHSFLEENSDKSTVTRDHLRIFLTAILGRKLHIVLAHSCICPSKIKVYEPISVQEVSNYLSEI